MNLELYTNSLIVPPPNPNPYTLNRLFPPFLTALLHTSSCEVEEGYKCAAPRDSGDKPPPAPGEPLPDVCVKKPPKKEAGKKEL